MKTIKYFLLSFTVILLSVNCISASSGESETVSENIIYLDKEGFLKNIYDYEENSEEWSYKGSLPCIIDFYADWCGPCKKVAPILEDIAKEYKGKIIIYKVNVDKERELAGAFGVSAMPTFLFVPVKGLPQSAQGAFPRKVFVRVIDEFLLKEEK